jgi:hypothetical protein
VVMKGDPASRISDVENVEIVFKDGVGFDSQKLIESARGRYGEYCREMQLLAHPRPS